MNWRSLCPVVQWTDVGYLMLKGSSFNRKSFLHCHQESDLLEAFNLLDYTGEGKMKAEDFRVAIKALGTYCLLYYFKKIMILKFFFHMS